MHAPVEYRVGVPEAHRAAAARLFDEAFGAKMAVAVRSPDARLALWERAFDLRFAIVAIKSDALLGLAGFQTPEGSLTSGIGYGTLVSQLGVLRGTWAALVLGLYERAPTPGQLLLDGITVHSSARGQGIGARLLQELDAYAARQGYRAMRLDVIETNPDARRLYERQGFVPTETAQFGYLRWLLGFGASTTMQRNVSSAELR